MGLFGKREQPKLSHQTPGSVVEFKTPPARVAKPKPAITHKIRVFMRPSDIRIIMDKIVKKQKEATPGDGTRCYVWYEDGLEIEFHLKETEK